MEEIMNAQKDFSYEIEDAALKYVPEYIAFKYKILPYKDTPAQLILLAENAASDAINAIRDLAHKPVKVTICSVNELRQGLLLFYKLRRLTPKLIVKPPARMAAKTQESPSSPLAELVDAVIEYAILRRASDIHVEPLRNELQIRLRLDGLLRRAFAFPPTAHASFLSRLKIMAGMDIAEKRLPQDGRLLYRTPDAGEYDIRLATLPTLYGEKAVLRILEKRQSFSRLEELGFCGAALQDYRELLRKPHGLLLCCGATGCGKTTTMYASLQELAAEQVNIVTIEDPVERSIDGIFQCAMNGKTGFDFAVGLRAILRQDPNIILVGEIRDEETATIAVRAAITGHLVLATLHTNNAVNAIVRMLDMEVKPFLLADALLGVLSQRLVRRRCRSCGGAGCRLCGGTGYYGRTALYELLPVGAAIRRCIRASLDCEELYRVACQNGLYSFAASAQEKIAAGVTTKEEAERVYD